MMTVSGFKNPSKLPILHREKATLLTQAYKVLHDLPPSLSLCWDPVLAPARCASHMPNLFALKACVVRVPLSFSLSS